MKGSCRAQGLLRLHRECFTLFWKNDNLQKQRYLKSIGNHVNMSGAEAVEEKLFEFYTQGSVEYSALLLASTLGVFSPFAILVSYAGRINFASEIILGVIYLAFSVASGFSLSRLVGNVWLLYTVMPKQMRDKHNELASKFDVFNLGKSERVMSLEKHAGLIERLVFLLPILIYVFLLLSWVL